VEGWQFSIVDFTQGAPITTAIPEPVGWDAMTLHLKRDGALHGFFSFEDDSFGSLQYDGAAADILRNAYYNFGVDAVVQLGINYICDDESATDNLYLGQFDFTTFVEYTGDRCYVECATVVNESVMLYKKRGDQQVDLDSLASFDQVPVTQYVTANVQFESGTNQAIVQQLLNGMLPGSQITISGAANSANNGTFSVASAKPDWANVNPDGANIPVSATFSVTFNASNNTISVNQELSVQPGTVLSIIGTGNVTVGRGPYFTCNDGNYLVTSVQQFFGYTLFTVKLQSIPYTSGLLNYGTLPGSGGNGTPATGAYFVSQSVDSAALNPSIAFVATAQPTKTVIQIPLQPVNLINEDGTGAKCTCSITGTTLTVTAIANEPNPNLPGSPSVPGTIRIGQGIGMGATYIVNQISGITGGVGTYTISQPQNLAAGSTITTGILFGGQWLVNNLPAYTALGKVITIPAKEIVATSVYKTYDDLIFNLIPTNAIANGPYAGGVKITPNLPAVVTDIDETDVGTGAPVYADLGVNSIYNNTRSTPGNQQPDNFIFFRQGSLPCTGLAKLKYNFNYQFIPHAGDPGPWSNYAETTAQLIFAIGTDPTNVDTGSDTSTKIVSVDLNWYDSSAPPMQNVTAEVDNINFPPGTYLWMWVQVAVNNIANGYCPDLVVGAGTEIDFSIASLCQDTPCATYFVNEAMSRCVESYTNGAMQVYSDYFGRMNAQPVASPADGCGGNEVITNGVRIRGCIMPDGSAIPKMFTSLQDMFTALDAIHNIGVGLEADPNRPGFYRLRVEPYEWFFNSTILLSCDNILKLDRSVQQSLLPSTFTVGYEQFETWNNNGLYDIFGKRSYRTPLNQLQNAYNKVCKWMASDYAIEFTRRQFGVTTSDSRYDDSTFILCLSNQYQAPVELVNNCIMVIADSVFVIGDVLQISGSNEGNNNSNGSDVNFKITGVRASAADLPGMPSVCFISLNGATLANEFNPSINFTVGSGNYNNVAAYFIGPNGALILDQLDLFNVNAGDTLQVTNDVAIAGNYTVSQVCFPELATTIGSFPAVNFPMVLYITAWSGSSYNYAPAAIITGTSNPFYVVEQNMQNGTNILSPTTVMNYRISPGHNAMRHYRNVITDRYHVKQNLIFTGGEGNFYALGQLNDSCTPEVGNISEGGNLSQANFSNPVDAQPLFFAEIVKFEYPLSWADFLNIQANPYGLIQFRQNSNTELFQSGWLVDLEYKPYTGMATFSLYPANPGIINGIEPVHN
jgi:hypothetical protein